MAWLDNTGLAYFWSKCKAAFLPKNYYGVCTTAEYEVAKTVTIPAVKALEDGMVVHVRFPSGNSADNPTLNVNSLGAYPMRLATNAPLNRSASQGIPSGATLSFVFNGGWLQLNPPYMGGSATGTNSVSEGYGTTASGNYSHAAGHYSQAAGAYSYAGGYGTVASGSCQTAIGKYNVANTNDLLIVGNGTGDNQRSNAFHVTCTGDAIAAGYTSMSDTTTWAQMFHS